MWGQRFLWLWITGILFGGAVCLHTQAPLATLHCPPYEQKTQHHTDPENCAPFNVLFSRSATDLRLATGEFIDGNRDDITAVSTLIVAIFTATLWYVTWNMVSIARSQRADFLRSVRVSEDAAEAANKSAEIAERALKDVERPHVFVELHPNIGSFPALDGGDEVYFVKFDIVNYGRFPASIEQCYTSATQISYNLSPAADIIRDEFHLVVGPDRKIADQIVAFDIGAEFTSGLIIPEAHKWRVPSANGRLTIFSILICYKGMGATKYRSAFCWHWDHAAERWARYNDTRYNYRI